MRAEVESPFRTFRIGLLTFFLISAGIASLVATSQLIGSLGNAPAAMPLVNTSQTFAIDIGAISHPTWPQNPAHIHLHRSHVDHEALDGAAWAIAHFLVIHPVNMTANKTPEQHEGAHTDILSGNLLERQRSHVRVWASDHHHSGMEDGRGPRVETPWPHTASSSPAASSLRHSATSAHNPHLHLGESSLTLPRTTLGAATPAGSSPPLPRTACLLPVPVRPARQDGACAACAVVDATCNMSAPRVLGRTRFCCE